MGNMPKANKPWMCLDCRVIMLQIDQDHCKCPLCGTEVWYSYNEDMTHDEVVELMKDNLAKHQRTVYDAMIGGEPIKGGGGRSNRSNSKKRALKKPSTAEIYNQLAKS